ncbi:unnamed protein product [Zymoseptoria tritici ST99CH_3D1]|nr:unnamed protein product [Zymoseptoria tritici ST99CH_3D1]
MASKQPKPVVSRVTSCLCQSVRIEITGEDKGAVLCHCNNCKQTGGSAFMHNHRFMKTQLNVVKGKELLREYADNNTKSGNTVSRHFCSKCGSPLYLTNSAFKGFAAVMASSMEGYKQQPFMELFGEDKYPWIGEVASKKAKL